jgi:hypothetical protein
MNDAYERLLAHRMDRRRLLALGTAAGAAGLLAACSGRSPNATNPQSAGLSAGSAEDDIVRPAGWSADSHSKEVEPNYDLVFPAAAVNQMTIRVTPETWEAMLANMTELFGARGTGGSGGGFGGPRADRPLPGGGQGLPAPGAAPGNNGQVLPPAGGGVPGGGVPGGGNFSSENPSWFAGTVEFQGNTWTNVGVRFKGNSSLRSGWSSGSDSLPFKLDFDEFEDDYPEIKDQRFHGFKQLSLGNNFSDPSFIRETVAYGILREAGLVAARTGIYEVLLDRGEGPTSLGLYTAIEVIDDTVIRRSFTDATGNIYEADGTGASFADGVLGQIESSFEVEGGDNADWSDIKALYNVIHSPTRTSDVVAWRNDLEAIFDVETFLEWLALSAAMMHWDTYGSMTHNYYLYNNPADGRLVWISWDHNLVLGATAGGGGRAPAGDGPAGAGPRMSTSLDRAGVTAQWPLIRYVLDQPDYWSRYVTCFREALDGPFAADRLERQCRELAAVIAPHVDTGDQGSFATAIDSLVATTRTQEQAIKDFLAK